MTMTAPPDAATGGLSRRLNALWDRMKRAARSPIVDARKRDEANEDAALIAEAIAALASHPREPWFSEEDREKIHAIQTLFSEYHFDGPLKHARDISHLGMGDYPGLDGQCGASSGAAT